MDLAFDRAGSGPPLLLLHPLGADRRVWAPVMDRLAEERDVIAVDLPGFGDSRPLRGGPPTPARLAEAVHGFARTLMLENPHAAGNSLGGWVALELALKDHVRSVTAIAPAGLWSHPLTPKRGIARGVAKTLLPALPAIMKSPRGRRAALLATVAHPERIPPADAIAIVRAYAQAPGFREVNDAMRANVFTGLERIRVPVTLAWPQYDRLVARPAHLPPTVRNVPLPDCGHVPMWDDPARVARLLLSGSAPRPTPGRADRAMI